MLLRPVDQDGRTVYEGEDERTLSKIGPHSLMTTYHKDLMRRLGFFADGELVEELGLVEQRYRYDPEADELVVENRIPLPDDADPDPLGLEDQERLAAPSAD